jgi:hypothetical protein
MPRSDKHEAATRPAAPHGNTEVHYGKKFAETEAILRARAEERVAAETERPAGPLESEDNHLGSTEAQVTTTPAQPSSGAVADEAGRPGESRGGGPSRRRQPKADPSGEREHAPLGATPTEELPPTAEQALAETPGELIGAFRDQVSRSVRGVGEAARQLRTASREVAGLPVEALRLAIRVGRSWLGV